MSTPVGNWMHGMEAKAQVSNESGPDPDAGLAAACSYVKPAARKLGSR